MMRYINLLGVHKVKLYSLLNQRDTREEIKREDDLNTSIFQDNLCW